MTDDATVLEFPAAPLEDDEAIIEHLLEGNAPTFHPILRIWQEVLSNVPEQAAERVTAQWALKVTTRNPQIRIQEMNAYRDIYFGYLADLRSLLEEVIAADPKCLDYENVTDDAENNRANYKAVILAWNSYFLRKEMEWDCTADDAHLTPGALAEAHQMTLSQTGIISFLDQIGFQFDQDDTAELQAALDAIKAGR